MTKEKISNHKKLAMGKKAPVSSAPVAKKMKKGGVVKGKEVEVKHVAMKKGGYAGKMKSC